MSSFVCPSCGTDIPLSHPCQRCESADIDRAVFIERLAEASRQNQHLLSLARTQRTKIHELTSQLESIRLAMPHRAQQIERWHNASLTALGLSHCSQTGKDAHDDRGALLCIVKRLSAELEEVRASIKRPPDEVEKLRKELSDVMSDGIRRHLEWMNRRRELHEVADRHRLEVERLRDVNARQLAVLEEERRQHILWKDRHNVDVTERTSAWQKANAQVGELLAQRAWRPIETAPKDQKPILGWCPDLGVRVLIWFRQGWYLAGNEFSGDAYKPSHWLPELDGPKGKL